MPIVVAALGKFPKGLEIKLGVNGDQRKNRNHPDPSITKIGLDN